MFLAIKRKIATNCGKRQLKSVICLVVHTYNETAKLAKLLREVRRKRREAKDIGEITGLIGDWAKENTAAVKALERLLGAVRKAEKRHEDRLYGNRTEILDNQRRIG